jgi:hypothetical protein
VIRQQIVCALQPDEALKLRLCLIQLQILYDHPCEIRLQMLCGFELDPDQQQRPCVIRQQIACALQPDEALKLKLSLIQLQILYVLPCEIRQQMLCALPYEIQLLKLFVIKLRMHYVQLYEIQQ